MSPAGEAISKSSDSKPTSASNTFAVIACLFFASGFSSLIYQVVWGRLLVFVFGSTTFATASVLSVFMGGLALGSFIAGKYSDRISRPLLWYGILEGIIGLWALFVPLLLEATVPFYKIIWQQFHLSALMFGLLRFAIVSAALLLPTACMGATLPLISKFIANNSETVGFRVGTLYAVNTFGAVFGAALAGFVLLPLLGLKATTWTAATINFILFAAVIAIAQRQEQKGIDTKVRSTAGEKQPPKLSGIHLLAMLAFGISGAIAMIYEVGWTRALLLVIGSGTYAFTCMLTTFLVGIFVGSWLCARVIDKRKDPLLVFAQAQIWVAIFALLAMWCYSYLPVLNLLIGALFLHNAEAAIAAKFLLAAATFTPLTIGLGATFPAIVRAFVDKVENVGASVGKLYSANTLGAILGAFIAGFVLVPLMGIEKMLLGAAACNLLLGCAMLFSAPTVSKRSRLAGIVVAISLSLVAVFLPQVWDHRLLLLSQPLRRLSYNASPLSMAATLLNSELREQMLSQCQALYFADGISSNVGVLNLKTGRPERRLLLTNGNIDGGDGPDMSTQILLSLFPLSLKQDATEVCVVGYGTGVSTGTALSFPVKNVTSIELEQKVYEASKFFDHINNKADQDMRSHFEMNDGRNFLLATNQKFDVIVSEPSNPWQAGVCNLFTREYFDICHKHLKPGGIFSCWAQTTELSQSSIRSILSAVHSSFSQVLVLSAGSLPDIVILASDSPLHLDWQTVEKLFANPKFKNQLRGAQLTTPEEFAACIKADTATIDAICKDVPPNSDDHNYLEFAVCKTYETFNFEKENRAIFEADPVSIADAISFTDTATSVSSEQKAKIAETVLALSRPKQALIWANWSETDKPNPQGLSVAAGAKWRLDQEQQALALWQKALMLKPDDDTILMAMAQSAFDKRHAGQVRALSRKAWLANHNNLLANLYLGIFAADPSQAISLIDDLEMQRTNLTAVDDPENTRKFLKAVCQDALMQSEHPNSLYLCGLAEGQSGNKQQSERLLRRYIELQPQSALGKRTLANLLWSSGKTTEAACLWTSSLNSSRQASTAMTEESQRLIAGGKFQQGYDKLALAIDLWPANYKAQQAVKEIADKVPTCKQLLQIIAQSGADDAARDAKRMMEPADDKLIRLVELAAAAVLLFLVLRKNKSQ